MHYILRLLTFLVVRFLTVLFEWNLHIILIAMSLILGLPTEPKIKQLFKKKLLHLKVINRDHLQFPNHHLNIPANIWNLLWLMVHHKIVNIGKCENRIRMLSLARNYQVDQELPPAVDSRCDIMFTIYRGISCPVYHSYMKEIFISE